MKFNIQKQIRKNCRDFEPYRAGKPIETIKRELGLKKVIKLASNENPLGPCRAAIAAIQKAAADAYYYPDSNSWALKQALAKFYLVDPSSVVLGAGSDEIIELIAKLFFNPGDNIVVSRHAFIRYEMAGKLMGCAVKSVPMKEGYTHDLVAMAQVVTARTKAIFIANPNNPTGTYNTAQEFKKFMDIVEKRFGGNAPLVVVDEAYYEYARVNKDYPDTLRLLSLYPNLIILRTFSKIYGLAGLRVGYGFASPAIVDFIDRIRPPFNINVAAQVAAMASLADKNQVPHSITLTEQGKLSVCRELDRYGIQFIASAANFVLIDVSPRAGADVFKQLLKEGVIVRAMDEYHLHNHIRVTIGTAAQNTMFLTALKKVTA